MNRLQVSRPARFLFSHYQTCCFVCASISVASCHSAVDGEVSAAAETEVAVHYYSPRGTMIVEESMADCHGVR